MMTYCNHQREQEAPLINQTENKIMKTFTVTAHCKSIDTEYQLFHDGEDWKEEYPFEQKTFSTREAALEFAEDEEDEFKTLVKFEVVEHDCDDK